MNLKLFKSKFLKPALGATLVVASVIISLVVYSGKSKAANFGPISAFNFRAAAISGGNRLTDYQKSVSLSSGDGVRIRLATAITQDADVEFYSNFGKDGSFGWVVAPGFDRQGDDPVPFTGMPGGKSVVYKPNSTQYQECNVVAQTCDSPQSVGDNSHNETPLFDRTTKHLTFAQNKQYYFYYDLKIVDEPQPAFNTHSTDEPTFRVRNVTKGGSFSNSVSGVSPGDELEFQIYVHNNPRGSVAHGVKVGVENWTSGPAGSFSFKGFVDADNADRASGTVNINLSSSNTLQFVNGSAKWTGWPTVLGPKFADSALSDAIITASGVGIGDQGNLDGCWDFLSRVYFRAKVSSLQPTPTPTPTPTPSPTPTPTPEVTPTPTPTPYPTPTPTPTPTPNPTPTPTVYPTPTPTPTPTSTPYPTPTPTPTPTPVTYATPTPTPQVLAAVAPKTGAPLWLMGMGLAAIGTTGWKMRRAAKRFWM